MDSQKIKSDLKLLGICGATILLTWLLALGWTPGLLVAGNDAVVQSLPFLNELISVKGDWQQMIYRPQFLGGAKIHEVFGTVPWFQFGAWLGFSAVFLLNSINFLIQILWGFFAVRAIEDLSGSTRSWFERVGLIWLTAFAPLVGWRIAYGHYVALLGSFIFIVLISMASAVRAKNLNPLLCALWVFAATHCFSSQGQQNLLYALVFGAPVFGSIFWMARRQRGAEANYAEPTSAQTSSNFSQQLRPIFICIGVLIFSVLLILPRFWGMVAHALGDDATRSLSGESIIYSYTTATLLDWVASIPWARELISSSRAEYLQHETNYPFGPLLFGFVLIFVGGLWKKFRALTIGMAVSFFAAVFFSMDIKPFSTVFPILIPPLKSFRVPARAMFPFVFALPLFFSLVVLHLVDSAKSQSTKMTSGVLAALCFGASVVLIFIDVGVRELLIWFLTTAFVTYVAVQYAGSRKQTSQEPGAQKQSRYKKTPHSYNLYSILGPVLMVALGGASVSAFRERLLKFGEHEKTFHEARTIGASLIAQEPSLKSPFTRIHLNFNIGDLNINSAFGAGLSSLTGYGFVPRRYLELYLALQKQPYNSTVNFFQFNDKNPAFRALTQLYNIRYFGNYTSSSNLFSITSQGVTSGEVWFVSEVFGLTSIQEVAEKLLANPDGVRSTAWLNRADPRVTENAAELFNPNGFVACKNAQATVVSYDKQRFIFRVKTPQGSSCPLIISTNFVSNFKASAAGQPLFVFPAYGALTGILIPAGYDGEIVLEVLNSRFTKIPKN